MRGTEVGQLQRAELRDKPGAMIHSVEGSGRRCQLSQKKNFDRKSFRPENCSGPIEQHIQRQRGGLFTLKVYFWAIKSLRPVLK